MVIDQRALYALMIAHFDMSDLEQLCFDLGIAFDDIKGDTRATKIRELILYCERSAVLDRLIEQCKRMRPAVAWDTAAVAQPQQPVPTELDTAAANPALPEPGKRRQLPVYQRRLGRIIAVIALFTLISLAALAQPALQPTRFTTPSQPTVSMPFASASATATATLQANQTGVATATNISTTENTGGWRVSGVISQSMGVRALFNTGRHLVYGADGNDPTCLEPVIGVSDDDGATWTPSTNTRDSLRVSDTICNLANVIEFAQAISATPAPALFAATEGAGVVRSLDDGLTWERIGVQGAAPLDTPNIHSIAVSADGRQIWAAGRDIGLYRSSDGGVNWARLDGKALCTGNVSLPADLRFGTVATDGAALYAATDYQSNSPGPGAGLFVSLDGGDCWRRLEDAEGGRNYKALRVVPGKPGRVLAYSLSDRPTDPFIFRIALFRSDMAAPAQPVTLWGSNDLVEDMIVVSAAGAEPLWYAVTGNGTLVAGKIDAMSRDDAKEVVATPNGDLTTWGILLAGAHPRAGDFPRILVVRPGPSQRKLNTMFAYFHP
jgi:hypothetical protein